MAATKLNPSAPPFPRPCSLDHLGQPAPPMMLPYQAGAFPPVGAIYICAQFPVPSPNHPFIQFPVLHPSRVFCKTGPAPPARFLRMGVSAKKPPARVLRKGVVPAQPTTAKLPCKAVPSEPDHVLPEDVGEPAPHGLPPHKLMIPGGGAKKQQAAAAATKGQVAKDVATRCRKESAPDATAAAPNQKPAALLARRKAERRRIKMCKEGAVVGPRAVCARPPPRASTWAPSSAFTTPRQVPLPEKPPAFLGACITVMVRNIPNRLKGDEMIALLDEHCARANRVAGDVVSAYDVVYLPMDFRKQGKFGGSNFGYAFVNFTTANAARGLYYSLQGCGWKVCGSRKTIDIVPAKIQGKEVLVRHFSRHKFECATEEYLPATFSPPRDGGARATATTTTRVGELVAPAPAPAPRHAKKKKADAAPEFKATRPAARGACTGAFVR